ncbi:hypothetical protein BASA83_001041 [Batrachochytrium salamandrivorans]|nr:hypothetical protein BASA83_001041 [Batrachochytrium salamandrivorans]
MVALAQVLTAAVLIPFAFGAPAADVKKHRADEGFMATDRISTIAPASRLRTRSLPISPDATCGNKAGFRCGPGDCCSQYNYCGATSDHCGVGCQSAFGVCAGSSTTTTVSPSPTGSLPISPDATCGNQAGFRCGPGDCCSQYNYCGATSDHCGVGCQSAFGVCSGSSTTTTVSSSPTPASTEFPAPDPDMAASVITTCTSPGLFALTLDDGPTKNVPGILDMLKKNNIKATFFVNGKKKADLAIEPFKSILLRAYTEGHQIASHTLTHQDLTTLNFAQMWTEMKSNDDLIRGIIGKSPMYMRPPFGSINDQVLTAMGTWGYKVVTWNADSNDWAHNGDPNMMALNQKSYDADMKGLPLPTTPFITLQHDFVANGVLWDQHVITKFTALGKSDSRQSWMHTARQAFIAAATNSSPDPVHCNTLRDEWSRLKAAATQLERVDGRKQWVKHADNLDRAVSDGRTDLVFAAARAMSGNSSRSAAVTPLYNSDGIVQYDPTSILRVMQGHYGSLAADIIGHSLELQYWHDLQPIQVSSNTPTIRNSDILDQDFSWNQIAAALLQMSPRKAPGDDGISTAFYQAALYMPANTQEGVPPTPFARALLRKYDDPLNPGDKRGIALINVDLKLVCKVLQMRIEQFAETNNLLSYEQAGFRKREECVGQVVSLVDIIQRRQNAGLNTHVLFIDIRKAFDTVPVGALLWKLQNMGFPRRTLAFLKALYTSSSARARAGSLLSDPFPVQRFPGLPRDTNPIRGLMYADDVAVFADSEQSLLAASTAVEQWANRWEMQFGATKCGIISFTGHLAPRLDSLLDIRLHGQLVSRVESYKYLGVLIDSKLDHSAWLKQKRSALEHTISALHPVLANHQLTVNYRSRIFSAVVMGKAYYGLELVGGNKSHLAPLQTTINKGIRLFTGARLSTAIGPLLVETGIGSLLTRSLVSRVRLLERSVTKRTPINAICSGTDNDVFTLNVQGQLVRFQRWFWSRQTKQLYRSRYWLTPQVRPKTVKQRHSFALMETLRTCGDSASLQKYVTRQLLDTFGFFKDPSFDQSRAHGT